ncbi:thiamine phosphate synthase [Uruburuella testudinis]|uniref:Thiamine-phosphate synthase n=1 Tax=Uruburuella testudinis TaxID=1282863 RepID=A0ABY4DPN1_9NEIS|nr:thiamine phosphate synthase [Uruburuella testudinis]UOO80816.1 thiamine phosphate synthase [Uruburuella testudinis]
MPQNIKNMLSLYFIAGTQDFRHAEGDRSQALLDCLEQALANGITCFQLREKEAHSLADAAAIEALARACLALCRRHRVPFFIDDNVDLALKIGADGIHVGQEDMPVEEVIRLCGGKLMIGLSTNTVEQAQQGSRYTAIDYFGVGPMFPTQSKAKPNPLAGAKRLQEIRRAGIDKPLVAIGGIKPHNVHEIYATGAADGIAVISVIAQSQDVAQTIRELKTGKPEAASR